MFNIDAVGNTKRISCKEYYACKLQITFTDTSCILKMGRLVQQYIVDMYVKLENTVLDFTERSQKRSELSYTKEFLTV